MTDPKLIKKTTGDSADFLPDALRIAELAWELKAGHIKALDMRKLTVMADCFVLCSAKNDPQLKAIFNNVKNGMKEIGKSPVKAEGEFASNWLVIDYGDIMFHVFRDKAYEFYDLEGLWGDAEDIELDLEDE
jgi:ribosome-associated protein